MKFTILICLLLATLIISGSAHDRLHHECMHDKMNEQFEKLIVDFDINERNLQQQQPRKMKITYDMSFFNSLPKDSLNQAFRDNCEKAIKIAIKFFSELLTVIPKSADQMKWEENKIGCGLFEITAQERAIQRDSDLHLYIVYSNEPASGYLAAANNCRIVKTLGATHGFVNFNLGKLLKYNFSDAIIFQDLVGIVTHEMLHILGFSGQDIVNWVDSNKQPYKTPTTKALVRGLSATYIRTPNVLAYAKEYYGCDKIAGMPVENQGARSSIGSHWEASAIKNELMCASMSSTRSIFSKFTTALLRDTGYYYSVNEQLEEQSYFGKGEGCGFISGQCDSTKRAFCDEEKQENLCDYYQNGSGQCFAGMFDDKNCAVFSPKLETRCFDAKSHIKNNPTTIKDHGLSFGANTKCFNSSLFNKSSAGLFDTLTGLCYKYSCSVANQVVIEVGTQKVTCSKNGEKLTVPGYNGFIMCPEKLDEFCSYQKFCPEHCSGNGYCSQGKCACIDGFKGEACNQRV